MFEDENIIDLADLFKIFGDFTRLKILFELEDGEKNVSDLCEAINMTQSAVSHQLKILRMNKLVTTRRDGKSIYYALADEHVHTILDMGLDHILED